MSSSPAAVLPFTGNRRFEVIRALGEGGMGVVYEVLDRERGMHVALKTLRWRHPEHLLRFKREFRALQDLHHPNLIRFDELIEDEGQWLLTMELLDGVDLVRWVRPNAKPYDRLSWSDGDTQPGLALDVTPPAHPVDAAFDEARLRAALAQLADGLAALHRARKVHRDIKPSNILVTPAGRVVLLDFGLVDDVDPEDKRAQVVGTVEYMAPEQAVGAPAGPAADWYSVGALLYEALTGRPPFCGTIMSVLRRKQQERPPLPRFLVKDVPVDLEQLCLELLEPDPARRPSGRALLRRLQPRTRTDEPLPGRFVGREAELAELAEARCVLVVGEAGVGKSALVAEHLRRLPPETLVLRGRCYEREMVHYKAWDGVVDALSTHLAASPMLLPEGTAALARLFPVLERIPLPPAELPADPPELRRIATDALCDILSHLAGRRPLVLAIEDFHFADDDSLVLFRALFRQPRPWRLIATAREPAPANLPATRIALGRLSEEETRRLALELFPDLTSLDSLLRESAGHPLFVHLMARHARSPSLSEALWAEVKQLPPEAQALMEVLAVADAPLEQHIAARAAGGAQFHGTVAQLSAQRLVRAGGTRRYDTLEPAHELVRAAVLAHLGDGERRGTHARLAEAMAQAGGDDFNHFAAAGEAGSAVAGLRIGAEQAFAALAFERAASLYEQALALADDDAERRRLHAALADVHAVSGHGSQAAAGYRAAAELADEPERSDLERKAAEQLLQCGRLSDGIALLQTVLKRAGLALPRTTGGAIASLLYRRARIRMRGLRFTLRHEDEVDPALLRRIDLTFSIASSLPLIDGLRGAIFTARTVLLALEAGEPSRLALALCFEAGYLATGGSSNSERVNEAVRLARELATKTGDAHARAAVIAAIGSAACLRGDFAEAVERLAKADRQLRRIPAAAFHRVPQEAITSWALYYRGELAELGRRVEEGLRNAQERGDLLLASTVSSGFANLAWLVRDDAEGAHKAVVEAIRLFPPEPFQTQHLFGIIAECQIDLYVGQPARALQRLDAVWRKVSRSGLPRRPFFNAIRLHMRARVLAACGKMTQACEDCAALEAEGEPWTTALAATVRAALAPAAERDARLREVAIRCDDLGLQLLAAACRFAGDERARAEEWFAGQGVRAPNRFARIFVPSPEN